MALRLGRVVNVNPKAHSVDMVMTDTGTQYANVQVLSHASVSSNTGVLALPTPTPGAKNYDLKPTHNRDVYAYVDFAGSQPIVVGFKVPEIGQMTFDRPGFRVDRHESDWYSTINAAGDVEHHHPSGSFLRLAADPAHEDLTGQDFDKQWKLTANAAAAPYFHYRHCNAGTMVFDIQVDPSGNMTMVVTGSVTSSADSWTHTGDVTIDGDVHSTGTITGDTDVIADTISGKSHHHSGVTTGGGNTGTPV